MTPLHRAHLSLDGLSIGDAFGECFFVLAPGRYLSRREIPAAPPWRWTDDSAMAIPIVEALAAREEIELDALARRFGARYQKEPWRGYGAGMHRLLPRLHVGEDWRVAAKELFGGGGSFGNGAAMRAAPIGAYFADDLKAVVENARKASEITHAHFEGICGGIAVAVGAAVAWQIGNGKAEWNGRDYLKSVLEHVPESNVRRGIVSARGMLGDATVQEAAATLGCGEQVTAQDTVPFVLWCAAKSLDDFEQALWLTVSGLGDRDTTCAMVGGIVALSSPNTIPSAWRENREPLPI